MKDGVELLAPAGSFDSLKAAVFAGADAVYLGGVRFGARAYADNFDNESLKRAIEFAHIHRKKIYLTLNTLLKEDEISSQLGEFLVSPYREGLDAVIVQDLGVLSFVRENFPQLKIHASTQMGITTACGVQALSRMGVRRVILPRELSLKEIRGIAAETDAELEIFVHGAMCYSYSGQCLMSGMIGGRSGNRGRCAGPCRLPFQLREGKTVAGSGKKSSAYAGFMSENRYLLNMKDLCTVQQMPLYLEAGVSSLKIEGRMKNPEYVAGTVEIYRKYLDRYLESRAKKENEKKWQVDAADLQNLTDLYSRGSFTDGYLRRQNGPEMIAPDGPAERIRRTDYIQGLRKRYLETEKKENVYGIVKILKHKEACFQLKYVGTSACVYGPVPERAQARPLTEETVREKFSRMGNTCFSLEKLDILLDEDLFLDVRTMNEMRRACVEQLTVEILKQSRREPADRDERRSGQKEAAGRDESRSSQKEAADGDEGRSWKEATGRDENRNLVEPADRVKRSRPEEKTPQPVYTALISDRAQWEPVLADPKISEIYVEEFSLEADDISYMAGKAAERGKKLFLAMPHIFRERARTYWESSGKRELEIIRKTENIGYLVRNLDECEYLMRMAPKPMVFDYSCWCMNDRARAMWEQMGGEYTLRTAVSPELNEKELLHSRTEGCEFVLYGKIPAMVTANCLKKTTVGCSGQAKSVSSKKQFPMALIDRKKTAFDVRTVCRYCYNLIYNSVPISLGVEEDRLHRFGFGAYRYQFTTESARETEEVLQGGPVKNRTRGHFYRGVE